MRGAAPLTIALMLALPAAAETDPPLSAKAFESIVQGRTFDTHDETGR